MALNLLLKASDKKVVEQLFDTVFRNRNEEDITAIVSYVLVLWLQWLKRFRVLLRAVTCLHFTHVSRLPSVRPG